MKTLYLVLLKLFKRDQKFDAQPYMPRHFPSEFRPIYGQDGQITGLYNIKAGPPEWAYVKEKSTNDMAF